MSRQDFRTYHIETDFGNLAYHVKGNSAANRAIVFLHGHLDSAMENGTYRIFDAEDSVLQILLDHRSHGSSTRSKFYPTLSERAEDIDILIPKLSANFPSVKELTLVGYSQGGSVLLLYLLKDYSQKNKITSAVLIAPRLILKRYLKWFKREIEAMSVHQKNYFTKKYKSKGYINYNTKYTEEFENIDYYQEISSLKTKTVLVRGSQDELITKEEAEKLINLNARFLTYREFKDWTHYPSKGQWHELYSYIRGLMTASFNS